MTNHHDAMRVAPDPKLAEELRQRLHQRLRERVASASAADPGPPDPRHRPARLAGIAPSDTSAARDRTSGRRAVAIAAGIVVIGAAAITIASRAADDDLPLDVTDVPRSTAPMDADDIVVTSDSIEFGDGLAGGSIAGRDGHLYLLAGHVRSEIDLLVEPETAVVAAFDDAGVELWRTELDGVPRDVVAVRGEVWVERQAGSTLRLDRSDGRVLGDAPVRGTPLDAFGRLWLQTGDLTDPAAGPPRLVRIDPDPSTKTVDLPVGLASGDGPGGVAAGAGALWVPLKQGGVARIDPDTLDLRVLPVADIGHVVMEVATDGDVVYVTDGVRVTSIVGGAVVATVSAGEIWYLGQLNGVFGVLLRDESEGGGTAPFHVLQASAPMVSERREIAVPDEARGPYEVDGRAWWKVGRNFGLRRVELLPVPAGDGG